VEEVAARDGYRSLKDPDMEGLGTGGKAQALQIAGTERGSGSGDLRGFSIHSPILICQCSHNIPLCKPTLRLTLLNKSRMQKDDAFLSCTFVS
jgi:hypothetical protein